VAIWFVDLPGDRTVVWSANRYTCLCLYLYLMV
jgi:hypothetical protein